MTESKLEISSDEVNRKNTAKHTAHEFANAMRNFQAIESGMARGRVRDISDEIKQDGRNVVIVGSGPSLNYLLGDLKKFDAGIVCTQSQALLLVSHGIIPDYILALDPFACWDMIKGYDWSKHHTKLLCVPTVWPDLVANWPNDIVLFRQTDGKPSWYDSTMPAMYTIREGYRYDAEFKPIIRTAIPMFSSSIPAQLLCASVLGYGDVYLAGCDFGYVNFGNKGKYITRCDSIKYSDGVCSDISMSIQDIDKIEAYASNGCPSDAMQLFYKRNFLSACRLAIDKDIFVLDPHNTTGCVIGAIGDELPHVAIEDIACRNKGETLTEKKARIENYLASVGCFVIETESGAVMFVESSNPMLEVAKFIDSLKKREKSVPIDKNKNMSRIKARLDAVKRLQVSPGCLPAS